MNRADVDKRLDDLLAEVAELRERVKGTEYEVGIPMGRGHDGLYPDSTGPGEEPLYCQPIGYVPLALRTVAS